MHKAWDVFQTSVRTKEEARKHLSNSSTNIMSNNDTQEKAEERKVEQDSKNVDQISGSDENLDDHLRARTPEPKVMLTQFLRLRYKIDAELEELERRQQYVIHIY